MFLLLCSRICIISFGFCSILSFPVIGIETKAVDDYVETKLENETIAVGGYVETELENDYEYTFAVIPKVSTLPFFDEVRLGCEAEAARLGNVKCLFLGPEEENPVVQNAIIRGLIKSKQVQGIAISVSDDRINKQSIDRAMEVGIPVITFDSDSPDSSRLAYVGTDNYMFGNLLAKVLLQLDPEGGKLGGKYGLVSGTGTNLIEREKGFRDHINSADPLYAQWKEVDYSPSNCKENETIALEQMYLYAGDPEIRAIVPFGAWSMLDINGWKKFVDSQKNKTMSLVNGDALDIQIELLNGNYCDGLVGQLPFEMGRLSIETLLSITKGELKESIINTNLLQILRVPNLPLLIVNNNNISSLRYFGYGVFGVIALFSVAGGFYCVVIRKVVHRNQLCFLMMICAGTLILGSFVIPTGFDDEYYTPRQIAKACATTPWLVMIGFNTLFSALFAKKWRFYQNLKEGKNNSNATVTDRDIMLPFVTLMTPTLICLILWTVYGYPEYIRQPGEGTDAWNRITQTNGQCTFGYSNIFFPIFIVIIFASLLIGNIISFMARSYKSDSHENELVGLSLATMLQASIIGVPLLHTARISISYGHRSVYVIQILLVSVICITIQLLIFIPKIRSIPTQINGNNRKLTSTTENCTTDKHSEVHSVREITSVRIKFPSNLESGRRSSISTSSGY